MQALIEHASYVPHGYCLFWQPWLVALYAGSDLLIFVAYSAIPIALVIFLRRRPDLRFRGLVALFAAFILLCGITHLISILTLWVPVYPLHGLVKLVTGIVSAVTAVVLFGLIPRLVAIPSPQKLEAARAKLQGEIAAHETTMTELRAARRDLEDRVAQRTAELSEANGKLAVATREAVHRGRNLLSVVTALARHTAQGATDPETFAERFSSRLAALANATATVMTGAQATSAPLAAVVRRQLEPILMTYGERVTVEGPAVEVSNEAAQQMALALHELATNAIKFGALGAPGGTVRVGWEIAGEELTLTWRERGRVAEAAPAPDAAGGFGTKLLTRAVPAMLEGAARRVFDATGMAYVLRAPVAALAPRGIGAQDASAGSDIAAGTVWTAAV